jgi:hypothetical protein
MKGRCSNKNLRSYQHYGGRGITVCDEWKESFENFYADMGKRPSPKHSIDRIDVDGNYCKENCRWASKQTQSRNTRIRKDCKSGHKGVNWHTGINKWVAYIRYGGKQHHIGTFDRLNEAISERLEAERKHWGQREAKDEA